MSRIQSTNVNFILAFVRNLERETRDSNKYAFSLAAELKGIVLDRVESSIFLSGILKDRGYSINPIKAYKLGNAVVSGQGMEKVLTINGIEIERDDWYWGAWDRKKRGVDLGLSNPAEAFGDFTAKPVPVFIPGYMAWRAKYNGLSDQVDLSFTGNMLDNFEVDVERVAGSNQYGGRYEFTFLTESPYTDQGDIVDFYRGWLQVTEEELRVAVDNVSEELIDVLFAS